MQIHSVRLWRSFCCPWLQVWYDTFKHYNDVIMGSMASQITSLTIVYSTVYSGADQSKHQSSASLAFVWEIHRGPVNSLHKWPVTRKMFPFDDVIMRHQAISNHSIDNAEHWDPCLPRERTSTLTPTHCREMMQIHFSLTHHLPIPKVIWACGASKHRRKSPNEMLPQHL